VVNDQPKPPIVYQVTVHYHLVSKLGIDQTVYNETYKNKRDIVLMRSIYSSHYSTLKTSFMLKAQKKAINTSGLVIINSLLS
jgi:hypothetical protein